MIIPLSLALPAGGAVLLIIALVAAALGLVSAGDIGRPPAPAPAPDTPATAQAARPGTAPGATPVGPRAQRLAELDARFQAARDEFEASRHTKAFARPFATFASLADQGHCESARLALQLVQAGPEAYLTPFQAEPQQISRWRALPGCWPKAVIR